MIEAGRQYQDARYHFFCALHIWVSEKKRGVKAKKILQPECPDEVGIEPPPASCTSKSGPSFEASHACQDAWYQLLLQADMSVRFRMMWTDQKKIFAQPSTCPKEESNLRAPLADPTQTIV
jgi:hypothetical protein